jgi:hypothetical protein
MSPACTSPGRGARGRVYVLSCAGPANTGSGEGQYCKVQASWVLSPGQKKRHAWDAVNRTPFLSFYRTVGEREGCHERAPHTSFTLPGCDFISASRILVISHLAHSVFRPPASIHVGPVFPKVGLPCPFDLRCASESWRSSGDNALSLPQAAFVQTYFRRARSKHKSGTLQPTKAGAVVRSRWQSGRINMLGAFQVGERRAYCIARD